MVEHTVQKIGDKVGNQCIDSLKISPRLEIIGRYQAAWLQSLTRVSWTSTAARTSRPWRRSCPRGPPPPPTGLHSSQSPPCTRTTAPSRIATPLEVVIPELSVVRLTMVLVEMRIATEKVWSRSTQSTQGNRSSLIYFWIPTFLKQSTENIFPPVASKLTRQMSKSRMKVIIDDDAHSPDRKVLSWRRKT